MRRKKGLRKKRKKHNRRKMHGKWEGKQDRNRENR